MIGRSGRRREGAPPARGPRGPRTDGNSMQKREERSGDSMKQEHRDAAPNRQEAPETSVVYGKNAVTELLKSGAAVDTVYVQDTMQEAQAGYYTALARAAGAVVKRVRAAKLRGMCGTDSHQGVAAWGACVRYASVEEILAAARETGEPPFLVLADGVEDPHNLGAILRSALLCGAHGAVIPRRGGVAVTSTVLKSSAGAAARLPVARVANIGETVRRLKAQNIFVYCADLDGADAFQQDLTGPIALVMGGEGSGVSPLVRSLCDGALGLPMQARGTGVDSFNVSVAAGILLYQMMRQRAAR